MARYNKSGLTVEQAQEIFDKCIGRGGKPLQIKVGNFFGKWIIGNVGKNNGFYLFEEVDDCINVSYSTNPKTGITDKLLYLANQYGFLEDYSPTEKIPKNAKYTLSLESICIILKKVVEKLLPRYCDSCVFARPQEDGMVSQEDLQNCPSFSKNGTDFYLVSVINDCGILAVKYANKNGKVFSIDL